MALEREESLSFEGQRSGPKRQAWWPKQKLGAHILNHKHGAERANRKLSNPPSPHPLTYFLQEGCTCTSPQTAPPPGGQAVKHPHLWGHLQLNCYRPRDQKLGSATRPGSPRGSLMANSQSQGFTPAIHTSSIFILALEMELRT